MWESFFKARTQEISKAIYYGAKYQAETTPEISRRIHRVRLCQEFGWTLEYADSLLNDDPFTVADILGVLDGQAKLTGKHLE